MKNQKLTLISLSGLLIFVAMVFGGCAHLEVLSDKCAATTVQTNGESDYAFKCVIQARNKGVAGKVRAKLKLHTPEGQFYREQVVDMASDEVKTFEFLFTEPSFPGTELSEGKVKYEFSYDTL